MTREEALRYVKSAAGHLIVTDRKVVGMALLEAWDALRDSGWLTTATDKPDSGHETVIVEDSNGQVYTAPGWIVRDYPDTHPRWMHLPKRAGSEARKAPEAEGA